MSSEILQVAAILDFSMDIISFSLLVRIIEWLTIYKHENCHDYPPWATLKETSRAQLKIPIWQPLSKMAFIGRKLE